MQYSIPLIWLIWYYLNVNSSLYDQYTLSAPFHNNNKKTSEQKHHDYMKLKHIYGHSAPVQLMVYWGYSFSAFTVTN